MTDAIRMNQDYSNEVSHNISLDEKQNVDAIKFFKLLKDFNKSLQNGCTTHKFFLTIARVFTIKLDYELSGADYDSIIE